MRLARGDAGLLSNEDLADLAPGRFTHMFSFAIGPTGPCSWKLIGNPKDLTADLSTTSTSVEGRARGRTKGMKARRGAAPAVATSVQR